MIWDGFTWFSTIFMSTSPDFLAENRLMLVDDGIRLPPGSIMPRDSQRAPMVLAVPKNGQMPGPV